MIFLLLAVLSSSARAALTSNVTVSEFANRRDTDGNDICQDNPDAPVCSCPCASQLVTITHHLQGGQQCMEPREAVDGSSLDPATHPYDHSSGRSRLQCKDLSQVFKKYSKKTGISTKTTLYNQPDSYSTWPRRYGGRASWSIRPAYATGLGVWTTAYDLGSSQVCAMDRTCLPELHNTMKINVSNFEKQPPYSKSSTQDVCNSRRGSNALNECTTRKFSQDLAAEYCSRLGMRLCDVNELMFEGEARHCGNHYRRVWTSTKCKNIQTNGAGDDTISDVWDDNYFWIVKQHPYLYNEAGDRICAHANNLNRYYIRRDNGQSTGDMFAGVTCCADTRHSPRFKIRYDDDNWSNNEKIWPPSSRTARIVRDGWKYKNNPISSTDSRVTYNPLHYDVAPEGTLKIVYQSKHASPDLRSCRAVYEKCMQQDSSTTMCDRENCQFVHGPFTANNVYKTIKFTSPIKKIRMNFRLWAVGDWQQGGTVRVLVTDHGPVYGISKAGKDCMKDDGWRKSEHYWNPTANSNDAPDTLYCYFDASFEFELATPQTEVEVIFQSMGDPNLPFSTAAAEAGMFPPNKRWWGFNHLQLWSTDDPIGDELRGKRGKSPWGKSKELIIHQDWTAATPMSKGFVAKTSDIKFDWKYTAATPDVNGETEWFNQPFTQILSQKMKYRIGPYITGPGTDALTQDAYLLNCSSCTNATEMRVSYDPTNPRSKNIQKMELHLKGQFPGGIWNGLSGGSPRAQTMNGKYNGRGRYLKVDFRLITVGRWTNNMVSVYATDERDDDVEYLIWTLTLTNAQNIMASKGSIVTQGSSVGTILGPTTTILARPTVAGMSIQIRALPGVTFVSTENIVISPNEKDIDPTTLLSNDILSATNVTKAARAAGIRHRIQNRRKMFPLKGSTFGNNLPGTTGKRIHPYACSGGWRVLPESVWLPTIGNVKQCGDTTECQDHGINHLHGVACYIDVRLRRLHSWGNPLRLSFESDITNNMGVDGELASYFAVSKLKVYGSQKVEVSNAADKCPGDGCTGLMVGLANGNSLYYGQYFGAMREENFGYLDSLGHRGDLPWDQYLRSRKEWGGGKLASPETSGLASTCNPPPYTFDSQGGGDDYDRSTCNLCGGDFWCSRNEPFPNATFVDPLRSNMTDPIRGRTITKMTIKAWGSMNLDKWHLENDATAGHVTVNGRQHRKTIASTGRDKWLYCNDCFESGAYTINEAEMDSWGYNYADAVARGSGSGTWSIKNDSGVNNFAVEPPQHSGWCLNKIEYQICARPGPPVIEKIEVIDSVVTQTVLCSSSNAPTCEINSDGKESILKITGYNFGPAFQSVKYGPLHLQGKGYEMKSCNLTANFGNREVICKTEPGTGSQLGVVVFANEQWSVPFNSELVLGSTNQYAPIGFLLQYKKPKILANAWVKNEYDVNDLPTKFVATDGRDDGIVIDVLHSALGNVGRDVSVLTNTCEIDSESGAICSFEGTLSNELDDAPTDGIDGINDSEADENEDAKKTTISLTVDELTTVLSTSKRAYVNFTIEVQVTSATEGLIGESRPTQSNRGIIYYAAPTLDNTVNVKFDNSSALITVTGNNLGGTINVGGFKVCGQKNSPLDTCNQVDGDPNNPILTNGGLTNFQVDSWTHNKIVFKMDKSICCPGSVYVQVGSLNTTVLNYPGQSPELMLSLEERSKIRDNRDDGVAQYYATKGGDVVTGIKVKYMTLINEVKIKVGGVEAKIRLQPNGDKGQIIPCLSSPCEEVYSYDIYMPEGQGTDVPLQVINTNGGEAGSDTLTVNYKPPTLSKISLEVNGGTNQELATLSGNFNRYMEQPGIPTLGNMLILDGSNFGQQGYVKWCLDPSATKSGCDENLKHTVDCCNTWEGTDTQDFKSLDPTGGTYGHDQIRIIVPAGVGVGRAIYVVQHRTSETTRIFDQISQVFALRYKAPRVTSVAYEGVSSGNQYADTRGGTRITLSGNYFGSASAIGEVVPRVPTIRLYRQSDIDNGNAKIQKEEAEADPFSNADDRTSSLTNVNYPSWGPAIAIESASWTDSSVTFVVPKGIGHNISIALTVGEQSSIDYHLSLMHFDASLFQYNPPIITGVTPASVPSSGLVHDTCVRDEDCAGNQRGSCDVGICSVGRAINMTITGNYFGDEDTSSGCAGFSQCLLASETPTNTKNPWRIRVQFINLGEITREVEAEAMTMLNHRMLSFPAPNSVGQAESTGYRIVVGNQVSEVYRQFTCASITDATKRQKCESDLANFKDIEDKLMKDNANGNDHDVDVDRDRLIGVLNGMDGAGKSVVDEPSLVKVTPLQGPTDGCDVYESIGAYQTRRKTETGESIDGGGVGDVNGGITDATAALELRRKCLHRDRITISGLSLGNGDFTSNRLEVWLTNVTVKGSGYKVFDAESSTSIAACNSITQFPYDTSDTTLPGGCTHGDNKIVFPSPMSLPNYGKELYYYVKIGGAPSRNALNGNGKAFLPWIFSPPIVTGVTPSPFDARGAVEEGTVSFSGEKCETSNCQLEIRGKNFGGSSSDVSVTIGDQKCLEPEWKPAHPKDGLPYLRCKPQQDVVGDKDTTIVVAAQNQTFVKGSFDFSSKCRNGLNPSSRLDNPDSPESYFGRVGELCLPCPLGAICTVPTSTDGAPVKWDNPEDQYLDPISEKSFFRITLNTTTNLKESKKRCDPKRVEASTDSMLKKYPSIVDKGFCFDFVGCMPKESCLANNKCARGYEHVQHRCEAIQNQRNKENKDFSTCKTNNDCRTRSGRTWDYNMEETCSLLHPEDCAVCNRTVLVNGSGTCTCSPPRRCGLCTKAAVGSFYKTKPLVEIEGYFRLDGRCEECPKNPILLFVFFFVAVFLVVIGGFVLSQKDFNIAFISIGVDYFQVLAVFKSARVEWPQFLKDLLILFTFFNFDIDVTAPECIIPEFTYEVKWTVSILLPVIAAVLLVLLYVFSKLLNLVVIERHKTNFKSNALISTLLLIIYYVYLVITKRALEVLNCHPAVPDDGHMYTDFTALECEASVCRCDENDSVLGAAAGLQQRLKPWAIAVLIVCTLGFPVSLFIIIKFNLRNIKIDQLLRAYDIDPSLTGSLRKVQETRERFHKMYYYFKPGKVFWIVSIVTRKGAIAIISFAFLDNPAFQFSMTVLVLFVSYVGAVKHHPYMSTAERRFEVVKHTRKVDDEDDFHVYADGLIKGALAKGAYEATARRRRPMGGNSFDLRRKSSLTAETNKSKKRMYFFDYNTVERVLLASAILIALAGIMFESGRFDGRKDLEAQKDFIAVVVILVVVFSLVYYMIVFIAEVSAFTPLWLIKLFSDKSKLNHFMEENNDMENGEIQMVVNPSIFTNTAASKAEQEKTQLALDQLKEVEDANEILQHQLRNAKKNNFGGKRVKRSAKKKRGRVVSMQGGISKDAGNDEAGKDEVGKDAK